jgi:hypothetical protein
MLMGGGAELPAIRSVYDLPNSFNALLLLHRNILTQKRNIVKRFL